MLLGEWFVIRRDDVGRRPESFRRIIDEITKMNIGEMNLGAAGRIKGESHATPSQCFANIVVAPFVPEMTSQ